jgi:ATP adenylyltransferase
VDHLWAPWRLEYVSRNDKEDGCFLCHAAERPDEDAARFVLWRSELTLCVMNRWPYNNGHLLVAPMEHVADFADLSEAAMLDQMTMLKRARRNLAAVLHPEAFNVGLNMGAEAGAGVPSHMHWHIVPRWSADTNFMTVTAGTRVVPQSLEALWALLRQADEG